MSGSQSVSATEVGRANRPVRVSLSNTVRCVTAGSLPTPTVGALPVTPTPPPSSVQPTATAIPTATATSLPVVSPTPGITSTPLPDIARGGETLRLVFIASTGSGAPGTGGDRFSTFDLPSTGGDVAAFYGFTENGATGIWWFEEDDLIGAMLEPVSVTVSPAELGDVVFIQSGSVSITESGLIAFIQRSRDINPDTGFVDFIDRAGLYSVKTNSTILPVSEGDPAPGREGDTRFTQFYSANAAESSIFAYNAFADGGGIWLWLGEGSVPLVLEGQALHGLEAGWRGRGNIPMAIAGLHPDGTASLYVGDYSTTAAGGSGQSGSGIWLVGAIADVLVANTGMAGPDFTTFRNFGSPSMNSTGAIAFYAISEFDQAGTAFTNRAIWKYEITKGLTKVAEEGTVVAAAGVELVGVSSPFMLEDGRVAFVGQSFDETNSMVSLVLVESGNGFDVIARTDALPAQDGGTVSKVPFPITQSVPG